MQDNSNIDLSKVNWNKLDIDQWHELEKSIAERDLNSKTGNIKLAKVKRNENKLVSIDGKTYSIPLALYERLINLRGLPREKLKAEILETYPEVNSI